MANEKLVLSTNEFYFKAPYTRSSELELRLENKSADQSIAFKVKTIEPRRYVVKPTNGIIQPGKTMAIKVILQALPNQAAVQAFLGSKQKFMVQWRTLASEPDPNESGLTLLGRREGDPMVEYKINCRFDRPSDGSASYHSVDGNQEAHGGKGEGVEAALSNCQSSTGRQEPGKGGTPASGGVACNASTGSACPLGCIRYLVALVALLIALYVAYVKYGDQLLAKFK